MFERKKVKKRKRIKIKIKMKSYVGRKKTGEKTSR